MEWLEKLDKLALVLLGVCNLWNMLRIAAMDAKITGLQEMGRMLARDLAKALKECHVCIEALEKGKEDKIDLSNANYEE